ncbi:MAG: cyclopropane fatty acyl phospholipid synthase [Desulfobacteraceae bacterium]
MTRKNTQKTVERILGFAGITINGSRDWDIQVHNENFYNRVLAETDLGLGESYMEKWWSAKALDQFIERLLNADIESFLKKNARFLLDFVTAKVFNLQTRQRSLQVGLRHYDIGNDLFKSMLDKRMLYTCGYWKNAETLDEAQEAKLDMICRKINLKPGMKVLDLGCGFGAFAKFAAENYGARVIGYNISKEQVKLGKEMNKGLPVELRQEDYRNASGKFDRVLSIGMLEHVGPKNYRKYMKIVNNTLKDDGIAFIHTIGGNRTTTVTNRWVNKYIFPNGKVPSIAQLAKAMEGIFVVEDWHNFGEDYDKTLMAWHDNFTAAWPRLQNRYGEKFYRMWKFYLLSCAAAFRARTNQLWQVVMTKTGTPQPQCRIV